MIDNTVCVAFADGGLLYIIMLEEMPNFFPVKHSQGTCTCKSHVYLLYIQCTCKF